MDIVGPANLKATNQRSNEFPYETNVYEVGWCGVTDHWNFVKDKSKIKFVTKN